MIIVYYKVIRVVKCLLKSRFNYVIVKRYNFNKNYAFYFSSAHNCLFIQHFLGTSYFFLPSYFFYFRSLSSCNFIFLNFKFFHSFLTHLKGCISLYSIYFIKIRIRGLGYRLRSICDTCHYFFFNYTTISFFLTLWQFWLRHINGACY